MEAVTLYNSLILNNDIWSEIIKLLSICDLCRCQLVCTTWMSFTLLPLQSHHNRFMARLRLYSVMILKAEKKFKRNYLGDTMIELSFTLWEIAEDTSIYNKYHNLSEDDREYNFNHSELYDKLVINRDHKPYLYGEIYEYEYNDDCSKMSINCEVCNRKIFLLIMIQDIEAECDFRSGDICYFPTYKAVCLKCLNNQSNNNKYPIIGLTCSELHDIMLMYNEKVKPSTIN